MKHGQALHLCWYWAAAAALAVIVPAPALAGDRRFEHLTVADGLSSNSIQGILQDHHGFIWIATTSGLNKFDGRRITVYRHDPTDPTSISDDTTGSPTESSDGTIWVATGSGGLNRLDPKTGRFRAYRHDPADPSSLPDDLINSISEDGTGNLLLNTASGRAVFHPDTGRCSPLAYPADYVVADRHKTTWYVRHGAPTLAVGPSTAIREFPFDSAPAGALPDGRLLVSAKDVGLSLFDPRSRSFDPLRDWAGYPSRGEPADVVCAEIDAEGNILLGTQRSGLFWCDPRARRVEWLRRDPSDAGGLSSDNISALVLDSAGTLWIGTYGGGVDRWSRSRNNFRRLEFNAGRPEGLSDAWVFPLCEDREGRLWIGTLHGGITVWDRPNDRFERFATAELADQPANSIVESRDGTIWVVARDLFRFVRPEGRFRREPIAGVAASTRLRGLHEDRQGTLWMGGEEGLIGLDSASRRAVRYRHDPADPDSLASDEVLTVYGDRAGALWVGTRTAGLDRLDPGTGKFAHYRHDPADATSLGHNRVTSMLEDGRGRFWVATAQGVDLLDRATGRCRRLAPKDGLPGGMVYGVLAGGDGRLWLSTDYGLVRFDPESGAARTYTILDGLINNEFNRDAYCRGRDGTLYFGSVGGVVYFRPDELAANTHPPAIVVTSIKVNQREVAVDVDRTSTLRLAHDQNNVAFELAALDFVDPARNSFAWRLEGFDQGWVESGTRNFAAYTHLPPAEYTMHVRACNSDGVWSTEALAVHLSIVPAFWQTWWFRGLALLLFAAASYAGIGFVRSHLHLLKALTRRQWVGHYILTRRIGSGGMATVWEAHPLFDHHRSVAVKVLREELSEFAEQRRRFKQEGAIIDRLQHPNLVRVLERGESEGRLFLAMEYLRGESLRDAIARGGGLGVSCAVHVLQQLASVLAAVHARGIVHRDLKPGNVMLIAHGGDTCFAKLLDFGLARADFMSHFTESGTLLGTLQYMAPEQLSRSTYSPASDVYALGIIASEMLTGRTPFAAETPAETVVRILSSPRPRLAGFAPDVPAELVHLIEAMVEKDPDARPHADEVDKRAREILEGRSADRLPSA